jgi:hypothetical protein
METPSGTHMYLEEFPKFTNANYSLSKQVQQDCVHYGNTGESRRRILYWMETIQKKAIWKVLAIATANHRNQSHLRESKKTNVNDMAETVKKNLPI